MSQLLILSTVMRCPHLGTVRPSTTNKKVRFAGVLALRETDSFPITGCIFSTSSGSHPCVRVEWRTTAEHSTAVGDATLTEDSLGFCYAMDDAMQGAVQIGAVQPHVAGR